MNSRIWILCLLLVSSMRLAAQNCFTYTEDYADYEDAGLSGFSSDGTTATLYTSVEVDGYVEL